MTSEVSKLADLALPEWSSTEILVTRYQVVQATGHAPVRYHNIVASKRPRKIPPTPPATRGHPPSLERPPAKRPWRAAYLDYSG